MGLAVEYKDDGGSAMEERVPAGLTVLIDAGQAFTVGVGRILAAVVERFDSFSADPRQVVLPRR